MNVKIKRLRPGVLFPTRATKGSAGWDLYAPYDPEIPSDGTYIYPGRNLTFKCGFSLGIPEGYYVSIVPRSSMGKRGLYLRNAPATIDQDYTGELSIMLQNLGNEPQLIKPGDRVAQMILHKYHEFEFEEVEELSPTERGNGGFGSTGH